MDTSGAFNLSSLHIEKIIIAIVIVICIILFTIGLSRLIGGNWKNGVTLFLLGAGGFAGSIYWIRHPIINTTSGAYETVVAYEGADDEYELSEASSTPGGKDVIRPASKFHYRARFDDENNVTGAHENVTGAHENVIHAELQKLVDICKGNLDKNIAGEIEEHLETALRSSADDFKGIEALLTFIRANVDDCTAVSAHINPILIHLKNLAESAGEKSSACGKQIKDILAALDECDQRKE